MRTVRTSDVSVLINTSWTSINGYRELIADVYYQNVNGNYEFVFHRQRAVSRRSTYERKLIQEALRDYYRGYRDDNGTSISYNDYKELETMCELE